MLPSRAASRAPRDDDGGLIGGISNDAFSPLRCGFSASSGRRGNRAGNGRTRSRRRYRRRSGTLSSKRSKTLRAPRRPTISEPIQFIKVDDRIFSCQGLEKKKYFFFLYILNKIRDEQRELPFQSLVRFGRDTKVASRRRFRRRRRRSASKFKSAPASGRVTIQNEPSPSDFTAKNGIFKFKFFFFRK